jgi:pSer/pThr/pTyr-binding forkhead associated (FHA) protein
MHSNPIISIKNGLQAGERFTLEKRILMIGRDSINDIVIEDNSISRQHARISRKDMDFFLEDLDSSNGTHINGHVIHESTKIKFGDELRIGLNIELTVVSPAFTDSVPGTGKRPTDTDYFVEAPRNSETPTLRLPKSGPALFSLQILSGHHAHQIIPLVLGDYEIGRKYDNQVILKDEDISSKHSLLHVQPEGIWVKDSESANGTFVNNQRITEPVWLKPGDTIQFGSSVLANLHVGLPIKPNSPLPSLSGKNGTKAAPIIDMASSIEIPGWVIIALISLVGLIAVTSLAFAFLINR